MNAMTDNAAAHRFELTEEGHTTFADYRLTGERLIIDHVETPVVARGTGSAGRLMAAIADHARAEGQTITPLCSYAAAWLQRHPEFADLVG